MGKSLPADPVVADAYLECERITRTEAGNFSWGIRLLPAPKRQALSAVYALARRIDDIGDGDLEPAEKLRQLAAVRASINELDEVGPPIMDPVLVAVNDAATRWPIPLGAFGELIDGCEMDVTGHRYNTLDELVEYCRCVAGSIGRLSLGVFDPPLARGELARAAELADMLGIGLQLTNILRDIREDLATGRVYLPADDLKLFGCTLQADNEGNLDPQGGALAEVIRFEAARAWSYYDRGLQLVGLLDRRSAACCAAMAGIYRELLMRIATDPARVLGGRTSLPARDKLTVATRALLRAGAPGGDRRG